MKTKEVEVMLLYAETDQELHLRMARDGLIAPDADVSLE